MGKVENFLTTLEEQDVVKAIVEAEKNTSGEIRVHIEGISHKNHELRSREVFSMLKMEETKQRNGVLLYIAVADRCFQIYADKGINNLVTDDFWGLTRDVIEFHFKKKNFSKGIIEGVLKIGTTLKLHFPYDSTTDINELPNEVSKG